MITEAGLPTSPHHKLSAACAGHRRREWLKPGLAGRVKTLKGEEELRHAKLLDFWEGP